MARTPIPLRSSEGRSEQLSIERLVNLFPEQAPDNAKSRAVLHGTPGLKEFASLGDSPVEALKFWQRTRKIYAQSGAHLWEIDSKGNTKDLGPTFSGRANIATSDDELVVADGGMGFLDSFFVFGGDVFQGYVYDASTLNKITDSTFASFGRDAFFISEAGDALTYDGLKFASAESHPDKIETLIIDHRNVLIFGYESIEIWRNTGEPTFPLSRVDGTTIERYGTVSPETAASLDNQIAYLDSFGTVRLLVSGSSPKRVSTHAIEHKIQEASDDDFRSAFAFVYVQEGHEFYCLTVPNVGTFVYDAAVGSWHERRSPGLTTWRASNQVSFNSKTYVGDHTTGKIWELDLDTHKEGSEELVAEMTFPPIQFDGKRFTVHELQLDFEVGVGKSTGQGSTPQAWLETSSNGRTFKALQPARSLGQGGDYKQRVIWRRLGQHRTFHARVSISDPVKRAVYAAYPRVEVDDRGNQTAS